LFTHVLANCAHTIGKQRLCRRKREEGTEERQSDTHTHTVSITHTDDTTSACFGTCHPLLLIEAMSTVADFTFSSLVLQIASELAAMVKHKSRVATNITQDTPRV
jgi:hypothetical protein